MPRAPQEAPAHPLERMLPAGFAWRHDRRELLARRRDCERALDEAGFALGREPRARASELRGRRPLLELECAQERLLLRRLRHGGLLRWLSGARYLDPARPFRELAAAARLAAAGVPTPELVAARARRAPLVGWRLELVSRRVEGACDLDALYATDLAAARAPQERRALLETLGSTLRRLHAAGCEHPDLHLKNLLTRPGSPSDARVWVLDLDRAAFRLPLAPRARVRMLARLWRWCARAARRAGRPAPVLAGARVLRAYEPEREPRRALARALRTRIRREARWRALTRWLERPPAASGPAATRAPGA